MKRVLVIFFALLIILGYYCFARASEFPKMEGLTGYGCNVELFVPEQYHWHTYVWAKHGGDKPDWQQFYSNHQGSHARRKCLMDCDEWMKQMDKRAGKKK